MRRYLSNLTAEFIREILDLTPETGELRWRFRADYPKKWNSRFVGKIAGGPSGAGGRWQIRINDRLYLGYRLAWLHQYGEWPMADLDHKDGNIEDDRPTNLRLATPAQNGANRGAQKNNTSGFKGVSFDKQTGRWRAKIKANGRHISIGRFDTPEAAATAYAEAAQRLHGKFARAS
jgi:hypothetical protein